MKIRSLCASVLLLVLGVAGGILFSGCDRSENQATDVIYTCGMHPQIRQPKPGNCPICGMKLTPIRTPSSGATNAASTIVIDAVTSQNMDLRTELVGRGPVRRTVRTLGVVDFDETALTEVSTKFRGWVEKLYVDSTGQQMHRGDPLFEIYSPELYLAQTELLLSLASGTNQLGVEAGLRRDAATTKLRYWDISDDQIAELERTRVPKKTLRVKAPRDGTVIEKMVVEGQMVEAGMKLYRLADLSTVWVQAQVYEQDLPLVRLGQEALISLASQPEPKFRGRVTYVYPTLDDKTRTARVRMEFHNPGYFLKPGMYATVELSAELDMSAVLVPETAVLRSGEQNTVFVALAAGHFEPRTVTLGARAQEGSYQVLSGLKDGERVVTSGQFLLDSESQLREAVQKMRQPGAEKEHAPPPSSDMTMAPSMSKGQKLGGNRQDVVYICPMPEHVSLEYDHPGKCPLCGMMLVPVTRDLLAKIQPGGQVQYYTCPMPEHSDVREEKPGKCPRCGMTLIPVMTDAPKRLSLSSTAAPSSPAQEPKLYTCPMASHADVVSDQPGLCPKCEMKLVSTTTVQHGRTAEENWRKQHPASAPAPPAAMPQSMP